MVANIANNTGSVQSAYQGNSQNVNNTGTGQKIANPVNSAPRGFLHNITLSAKDVYSKARTSAGAAAGGGHGQARILGKSSSVTAALKMVKQSKPSFGRGKAGKKKKAEHEDDMDFRLEALDSVLQHKDTEDADPRDAIERLIEDYDLSLTEEEVHKNFKHADAAELHMLCTAAILKLEKSADTVPDFKNKRKRLREVLKSIEQQRLRDSLQERAETDDALAAMNVDNWVNFRYTLSGSKDGKIEALKATSTLTKLLKVIDDREIMGKAMTGIQRRFCGPLSHQTKHGDNQYVVASKDARVFSEIRSAKRLAEDLRVEMAKKGINIMLDDWDLARQILDCPETGWNKGKARPFMQALVGDGKNMSLQQQAYAWRTLRHTLTQIPLTLWPPEKMASRRDLLEEIDRNIMQTDTKMKPVYGLRIEGVNLEKLEQALTAEYKNQSQMEKASKHLATQMQKAKLSEGIKAV